jgi:hypothetical protein
MPVEHCVSNADESCENIVPDLWMLAGWIFACIRQRAQIQLQHNTQVAVQSVLLGMQARWRPPPFPSQAGLRTHTPAEGRPAPSPGRLPPGRCGRPGCHGRLSGHAAQPGAPSGSSRLRAVSLEPSAPTRTCPHNPRVKSCCRACPPDRLLCSGFSGGSKGMIRLGRKGVRRLQVRNGIAPYLS